MAVPLRQLPILTYKEGKPIVQTIYTTHQVYTEEIITIDPELGITVEEDVIVVLEDEIDVEIRVT